MENPFYILGSLRHKKRAKKQNGKEDSEQSGGPPWGHASVLLLPGPILWLFRVWEE
jgi:hypothetical protein